MSENQTQTNIGIGSHDALTKFSKSLIDEASNQKLEIINELKQNHERILNEKTKELEKLEHEAITAEKTRIAKETGASVAARRAIHRQEFILMRSKYADNIFERVTEKVREFADTPEYDNWLCKQLDESVKKIDSNCEIIFRALGRDQEKIQKHFAQNKVTFETLSDKFIGGFILICENKRLLIDCTLISKINDERENFPLHSGLIIK